MFSPWKSIFRNPTARLSRKLVLWVFISVIVIEAIILIPSYSRRQQELLGQLKAVTAGKLALLVQVIGPGASAADLVRFSRRQLVKHPILGGRLYDTGGKAIAAFGEEPHMDYARIKASERRDLLIRADYQYDVAFRVEVSSNNYTLILRHDARSVKSELIAFIQRIMGLVVIISIFVTVGAWLALNPLVITPILKLRQDLIGAGEAVRQDRSTPEFYSDSVKRQDELGDVISAFRQMFAQIQEAIAERKRAEDSLQESFQQVESYSTALNNELEKGRRIQRDFLPKHFPPLPGWDIEAGFFPARQVSGDFYDVFTLPGGLLGLVIGDVSDKGVGAALYMALIRSLMRVFSGHYKFANQNSLAVAGLECIMHSDVDPDLGKMLKAVDMTNFYICQQHGDEGMFASLFFGVLNPSTGKLAYINAGHEPIFIAGPENSLKKLVHTGPAVGVISDYCYEPTQIDLDFGNTLIGYTDGVTEARSPLGELYTRTRLQKVIESRPVQSAQALLENIQTDLFHFSENAPQEDDIAILAVRRSPM